MKIRQDFVTNSSSSSYVVIDINSKKIAEIFSRFLNDILNSEDKYVAQSLDIDDDNVNYTSESSIEVPESESEMVESLITSIDFWHLIDWRGSENGIEYFLNEENVPNDIRGRPIFALIRELWNRKDELKEDILEAHFEYTERTWGGNLDGAWKMDTYDEGYKKQVAEELGYASVEDMPEDRFIELVDPDECKEVETFHYVKGDGGEYNRTYRPE